jgi:hypothetical protein
MIGGIDAREPAADNDDIKMLCRHDLATLSLFARRFQAAFAGTPIAAACDFILQARAALR